MTPKVRVSLLLLVCACALPLSAPKARDRDPFQEAVNRIFPSYKMAWFYTRTGNPDVAQMELGAFQEGWEEVVARFKTARPPRYAGDKGWAGTLDTIRAINAAAMEQAAANELKKSHRTLSRVRQELRALRKRNGIAVFTDRVEAYADDVERLTDLRRKLTAVTPDALANLRDIARRLRSALSRIDAAAPAKLRNDAGFKASMSGNFKSVGKLDRGINAKNLGAIKGSVSAIRSDYVLLFIRYG